MYRSGKVKLEGTPSKCGLTMGKYSWQEDACVWLENYPMTFSTKLDVPLSTRSRGSVVDRFATLRNIGDVVEQKAANLADKVNIHVWNHFVDYKFRVKKSMPQVVPEVDADTVATLAKNLNIDFDFLLSRLQHIRNTKHFLYFGGIHLNEDLTLGDYVVTRKLPDLPSMGTRGGDLTLTERQAIYRFKYRINRSYTVRDLAEELNMPLERVRNSVAHVADQTKEVERMLAEGITLVCGEDTDLWSDYIEKHTIGSTHPANMLLSASISDIVAKDRNASPMYTHFRLNLIRNLKKYLHIAGIHEDPPSACSVSFQSIPVCASASSTTNVTSILQSEPNKLESAVALLDSANIYTTVAAAVLNDPLDVLEQQEQRKLAVLQAVDRIIAVIEMNDLVVQSVAATVADIIEAVEEIRAECIAVEQALPVVTAADKVDTQADANADHRADMNNGITDLTSASHVDGFVDAPDTLITELETGGESAPTLATSATSATCATPESTSNLQNNTAHIDIAITKHSLRSSEVKMTPCSEAIGTPTYTPTTITTTRTPVPIVFADEPLEVTAGAGNPYTMQEDRLVWRAWLTNPCFSDASAVSVGAILAKRLKRTSKGINRRLQKLLIVREEADQAVRDGFTLLPGSAAMRLWHAYCAFFPPMQSANSVYIHPPTVQQLAKTHGLTDLYDTLQAVRAIKWFLYMNGIHGPIGTDTFSSSVARKQTKESTNTGTMAPKVKQKPYGDGAEDTTTEIVELKPTSRVQPIFAEAASPATLATVTTQSSQATQATLDTISAPLTHYPIPAQPITPFAFSLTNEADIWRAYVKSQQPSSHKSLPVRLQKLAKKLSCTFPQIKDKLNELINLHLGLSVQCHSSGRPFTAAEEVVIVTALLSNNGKGDITVGSDNNANLNNRTTSVSSLVEVAARLRCSVGAVAVRSRQLKTLRLLQDVSNHIHATQHKLLRTPLHSPTIQPLLLKQPLSPTLTCPSTSPSTRDDDGRDAHLHTSLLGKRYYNLTDTSIKHKIARTDSNYGPEGSNIPENDEEEELIAYFSTEGEASDG